MKVKGERYGSVLVGHVSGHMSESDAIESAAQAFKSGLAEPGVDRIIIMDPNMTLHEIDGEASRAIQERVFFEERQGGSDIRFRQVFVVSTQMQKHTVTLYKAQWDRLGYPGVEMYIVDNEDDAWRILGKQKPASRNAKD